MAAEYDNLLKYLAENHAEALASWLLGRPVKNRVRLLKTELSLQPIRSDFLAQYEVDDEILHVEFETEPGDSEPPLPLRMLDYFVRTYRRERKLVRQVVIVLAETRAPIPDEFHVGETWHRYRVVKMWEQDPEPLLADPGLAPLAVLARATQPEELVRRVADQVQRISEPGLRSDSTAAAFLLAGLRFDRMFLRSLFKEEIMIHSSTYQDLVERSEARGEVRGEARGEARGELRGEARGELRGRLNVLQRQANHRFGSLPEEAKQAMAALDVPKLDQLSEVLLDFDSVDDLTAWLEQNRQ